MAYRYGPVVVGVDGSPDSIGALRWSADAACRWNRTLIVVTAVSHDDDEGEAIAVRAAAEARRWRVGIETTGRVRRGEPIDVLRGYAEDARLVVVGGRGAGGGDGRALGTVSAALGARADAPVLIVHNGSRWAAADAAMPRHGPVVTGFDGSDSARRALRTAFEEAASRCGRLVILQAWPHPGLWRPGAQRGVDLRAEETAVHQALREAAAPWCREHPLLEVEVRGEPGDPVPALAAASQWASLLVVGTRCPVDRVQPTSPSVAAQVLQHAVCPVLVAHGPCHAASQHSAAAAAGRGSTP
ncbi:universal stress protein [Dactylosporangium matsuzakiense]|uniref:UspA domain-containing protein n=1 Tax=Dactylosporangium matsuzakiense TaxID=53360 RepID=A0A9W6KPR3_9ACTN|nr:universal stress protein [Dactylosporangium matsuzakiense]UWZ42338.1 universal stress protein [Dactylosporangium matsuzakiense]GLL05288.1 hypothetical protein GCM10017581_070350 [Dactylosporangium matsuzakiense]